MSGSGVGRKALLMLSLTVVPCGTLLGCGEQAPQEVQGGAGGEVSSEPDCSAGSEAQCQASTICSPLYAVNAANQSLYAGCVYTDSTDSWAPEPTCASPPQVSSAVGTECLRFASGRLPGSWIPATCGVGSCAGL